MYSYLYLTHFKIPLSEQTKTNTKFNIWTKGICPNLFLFREVTLADSQFQYPSTEDPEILYTIHLELKFYLMFVLS
jgi:hypothetical protein